MSFANVQKWITGILDHPDLDKNHLAQKRICWISSAVVTTMILLLTLVYYLIFPHLRVIIYYGLFLSFIFLQGIFLPLIIKKRIGYGSGLKLINEILVLAATFVCIVRLGGIPYSGGLIIVGLVQVLSTLNYCNRKLSVTVCILYVLMVIVLGIIHPHLKVHPELTPQINISLYIINTLWISGFVLLFLSNFIPRRVEFEKSEAQKIKFDEVKSGLRANTSHEFCHSNRIIPGKTGLIKNDPGHRMNKKREMVESCSKGLAQLSGQDKPVLLIIDDNFDLISYLRSVLEPYYFICEAFDGHQGLEMATEIIPDLVLTGIMMQVKDGTEVYKALKNDLRTSHIPVVVLTAGNDDVSRMTGYDKGADAYIGKPFNKEELTIRLSSLLQLRKKLQKHCCSPGNEIEQDSANPEDSFMFRVRELMIKNISNEQFGINDICTELGMSRTNLYRKFRSLTDKTIAEYLRSIRLYKSRELLRTFNISVSDAAYRTGFKNIAHFSRVFTEAFGVNPSRMKLDN